MPLDPEIQKEFDQLKQSQVDLQNKLEAEVVHTHPITRRVGPGVWGFVKGLFKRKSPTHQNPDSKPVSVIASKSWSDVIWQICITLAVAWPYIAGILASVGVAGSLLTFPGCSSDSARPGSNPLPSGANRILVLIDESVPMSQDTLSALDSEEVWLYAGASLADGPEGTKEARIFDHEVDLKDDHPLWQDAVVKAKTQAKKLPYVAIVGKKASYSGDLPSNKIEMVSLLKKCFGNVKLPPPSRGPPMMVGADGADPFARKNTGYIKGQGLTSKGNFASFDMKLMTDAEIEAAIVRKNADKSWLSDIRARGNKGSRIPSRDQDGKGYCWAHSSVWSLIITRAKNNQPYVDLSAYAVACKIKNFRDEGGWGSESLKFLVDFGCPSSKQWPQQSMLRSNDNPQTWADASKHRVTEFVALDKSQMARQMATCLCNNIPVVTDLDWWAHSIVTVKLKAWGNGSTGIVTTIQNSWGDGWGSFGEGDLQGYKAIPDDAVAPRVANASYAALRQKHKASEVLYAQAP